MAETLKASSFLGIIYAGKEVFPIWIRAHRSQAAVSSDPCHEVRWETSVFGLYGTRSLGPWVTPMALSPLGQEHEHKYLPENSNPSFGSLAPSSLAVRGNLWCSITVCPVTAALWLCGFLFLSFTVLDWLVQPKPRWLGGNGWLLDGPEEVLQGTVCFAVFSAVAGTIQRH